MRPKPRHHPVGHAADTGLKRQQIFRQPAGSDFVTQELDNVFGDQVTDIIRHGHFAHMIRFVIDHDPQDLFRIHHGIRPSDPRQGVMDRDGIPVRRGRHHDDIRHFPQPGGMFFVDLDDHLIRILQKRGRGADG